MVNFETLLKENPQLANERTNVISIGMNMNCDEVITKCVVYKHNDGWCVRNGGIDIIYDDISDLYLDTKENRKELRKLIKQNHES